MTEEREREGSEIERGWREKKERKRSRSEKDRGTRKTEE